LKGKISILPLDKANKLKEGSWRLTTREEYLVLGKNDKECV
jgi:hypothetical protein